jgi:prepilin peptidase CpaA
MLGTMDQGEILLTSEAGLSQIPLDGVPGLYIAGFPAVTAESTILAILTGLVTWVAISDLVSNRIPNTANAAILALWIAWAVLNPNVPVIYSIGIGIALFAAGATLFHFNMMGGGDVKFLAVLGLFAGPNEIIFFLIYVSLLGGVLSILGLLQSRMTFPVPVFTLVSTAHGKRTVPYGVAIAAGAYIMIAGLWSA